jgi:hypothetical protein
MRTVRLQDFIQAVEDRKRSLGIGDEVLLATRNSGERRTPEKREMLARIRERARKAGLEPLPAKF